MRRWNTIKFLVLAQMYMQLIVQKSVLPTSEFKSTRQFSASVLCDFWIETFRIVWFRFKATRQDLKQRMKLAGGQPNNKQFSAINLKIISRFRKIFQLFKLCQVFTLTISVEINNNSTGFWVGPCEYSIQQWALSADRQWDS